MLRFVANANLFTGDVADRCVNVGGLVSMVDKAGSELFSIGWLNTTCFSVVKDVDADADVEEEVEERLRGGVSD